MFAARTARAWLAMMVCGPVGAACQVELEEPAAPADGSSSGNPQADAGDPTGPGPEDEGEAGGDGDADGSDGGDPPTPGPWSEGWPIPAEPQLEGDPVLGRHKLLHFGYLTCGIPYSMWGLVQGFLGSFAGTESLPEREGLNRDMPYDWTVHTLPSGVQLASQNCLQCHAGRFNGELVIGLGNADRDFTTTQAEMFSAIPIPEIPIGDLGELTRFLNRVKGLGPATQMRTVGTNPAEMIAISLVSHRDRHTLEWHEEPLIDILELPVPSDVPPWWRAKKKNALFYNAMARGDHRGTMILATALCTDDVEEAERIAAEFADIHAFVRSLTAPKYPFPIDEGLAAEGRPIFDANCAPCHGTYADDDADESYPNLLFPLDLIGTDPVVAEGGTLWEPELVSWYNDSVYGDITRMVVDQPFVGYAAPPLDGVWATGPFLHNGSVPNIALVIDSTKRPTYWRRADFDSTHFDEANLGWPYAPLDHGHDQAAAADRKFIYDTTQFAHDNGGHTFGDHLSDIEREAVIEYMKTL